MIKGICLILFFYFLGIVISHLIGGIIPGSVCGMLLLFTALYLRLVKPESVKSVAKALTQNMAVLFVPAGVGIMAQYNIIAQNWVGILSISIGVTIIVLLSVGGLVQFLDKYSRNNNTRDQL